MTASHGKYLLAIGLLALVTGCGNGSSDATTSVSTNSVPDNTSGSTDNGSSSSGTDGDTTGDNSTSGDTNAGGQNPPGSVDDPEPLDDQGALLADGSKPFLPSSALDGPATDMIDSIHRFVAMQLLSLNRSIIQGEMLTPQQEQCVGAYEPALGTALLMLECAQALSTDDVPIYSNRVALADTANCQASIANGHAESCVLVDADFTVRTQWRAPEKGRPVPDAGAAIRYSAGDRSLVVENLPAMLTGAFYCKINLETGASETVAKPSACSGEMLRVTALMNGLLPEPENFLQTGN